MKAFENAESLTSANLRRVGITFAAWERQPDLKCNSSYHILDARLFNLDYVSYLKYVANKYGAIIVDSPVPYALFPNSKKCDALVDELNKRWEIVCKFREENNINA